MELQEARNLLAAFPSARETWLHSVVPSLNAEAVWLAGSLGRGDGDAWSDVDLLVVDGDLALDDAILTMEVPANGPVGGRYVGAMYDIGPLPLWVDWFARPAALTPPRDVQLLSGHCRPSDGSSLFEALDRYGRGPAIAVDPSTFALAMLPLTAKYVARGQLSTAARMAKMLGVPERRPPIDGLRGLLASTPASSVVRARVACALDVVAALTGLG